MTEKKYGKCVLCGKRVKSNHIFFTSREGYIHRKCFNRGPGSGAQA